VTPRSGPIVIEIEYRVDFGSARTFYGLMQQVQLNRQRNGAYGWSIARDIANPELWTERYHCPTWHDYLRQRSRPTQSERALQNSAAAFHLGPESVRIRRMLERPFGRSVGKKRAPIASLQILYRSRRHRPAVHNFLAPKCLGGFKIIVVHMTQRGVPCDFGDTIAL
jgi:hypothetical protein